MQRNSIFLYTLGMHLLKKSVFKNKLILPIFQEEIIGKSLLFHEKEKKMG
jgi:hypothetical protein